jgi:hypothetical protein
MRSRGCVSLFDYRDVSDEVLQRSLSKCSPLLAAGYNGSAVAFILSGISDQKLLTWKDWEDAKAYGEMIVPHVEAGHRGPIPVASVAEIIAFSVEEDPDSIAALLRRAKSKERE